MIRPRGGEELRAPSIFGNTLASADCIVSVLSADREDRLQLAGCADTAQTTQPTFHPRARSGGARLRWVMDSLRCYGCAGPWPAACMQTHTRMCVDRWCVHGARRIGESDYTPEGSRVRQSGQL